MFMHLKIVVIIGWLLTLGACLIGVRYGGKAERRAALLILLTSIIAGAANLISNHEMKRLAYLAIDGAVAGGLLLLALRYTRAWLGVAVLLQGVQFSLHAYYIVADRGYDYLYSLVNNLVSIGVLGCLAGGSFLAYRQASAK